MNSTCELFKMQFLRLNEKEQKNVTNDIVNFLHQIATKPVISKIKEYVNNEIKYLLTHLGDYDIVIDNNISIGELTDIIERLKIELEVVDVKFVGQRLSYHCRGKLNVIFKNFEFECDSRGCTGGEMDTDLDYMYNNEFDEELEKYIKYLFYEYNMTDKMFDWIIDFTNIELIEIERKFW